jgi:hypothetical protein
MMYEYPLFAKPEAINNSPDRPAIDTERNPSSAAARVLRLVPRNEKDKPVIANAKMTMPFNQ